MDSKNKAQTVLNSKSPSLTVRPPVVAVLGHVDHGKTTLLDTIRKAQVAKGEHGGITQHIGAYQIDVVKKGEPTRKITFIDTPGHEAFAKIRSRGAAVADIAILVVAADDSVKPQTLESIEQIKAAGVQMIVAINKIDVQGAIVDKVKSDLAKVGVQVEGFGGDVPVALVSAKVGTGVPELLDLILLLADMKSLEASPAASFEGVVVEAKIDKFQGTTATILVKNGTLSVGTVLYEGQVVLGKVRSMVNERGEQVKTATPSQPVVVTGFSKLPQVGEIVSHTPQVHEIKHVVVQAAATNAIDFMAMMDEAAKKKLKIILKADTSGSLEAVKEALPKDQIEVVRTGLGEILEADILEAQAMGAIVIGFNVKAGNSIERLARVEKVVYRTYNIIYELLDEMNDVVEGMAELLTHERELGRGNIIAEFPFSKDRIAGTKVISGRLAKGDSVRIMREEVEIARVRIKSLKKGKEDITKIEMGAECGVLFDKKVDFTLQDVIIAYTTG